MLRRSSELSRPGKHVLGALLLLLLVAAFAPAARPQGWFRDFNAFYCAGETVARGRDPYRAEPLGTCEHRPKPAGFNAGVRNLTLPAPLPPYALAPFVPLAALPYASAAVVWSCVLLLALGITIEATHRASGLSRFVLFAVFAPIEGYDSIYLGETAPIVIAAVALATFWFETGRERRAAVALTPALLAPHVALPTVLALFLCSRRARPILAALGAFLALLSIPGSGLARTFEYLHEVLPAHALSEVGSPRQLSLTAFLHAFGAPDHLALAWGSTSYIAMLFLGLTMARILARRAPHDGLIIALPAALVLMGGVFIHVVQMPVALPAALLLFVRSSGRRRRLVGTAIVLLAIPWNGFSGLGLIFIAIAGATAFILVRDLLEEPPSHALLASILAGGAVLGLFIAFVGAAAPPSAVLPPVHPHDLAETNWKLNIEAVGRAAASLNDFDRLPAWLAISAIALALVAFASGFPKRRGLRRLSSRSVLTGEFVSR